MGSRKKELPHEVQVRLDTADRAFSLKEYDMAAWLYQTICVQKPDIKEIHFKLGMAILRSNHVVEAIQTLRLAVAQEPERKEIWLELARAYIEDSDFETGRRYLKTLTAYEDTDPHLLAEAHYELGNFYYIRGNTGLAQDHFEAALTHDPDYLDADLALAQVFMNYRQYEHARDMYRRMLKKATRTRKPEIAEELRNCLKSIGRENNDIKYWQPPPAARVQ